MSNQVKFYLDEDGIKMIEVLISEGDRATIPEKIVSRVSKHHIKHYPKEHEAFLASLKGGDPESISESTPKKVSKPKKEKKANE